MIFVVDDDSMNREIIEAVLVSEGFEVTLLNGGINLIERASSTRPSLILMDVRMPNISGLVLCSQLRSNPSTQDIPVVIMTGYDSDSDRAEAYASGATGFLSRPFSAIELIQTIQKHV